MSTSISGVAAPFPAFGGSISPLLCHPTSENLDSDW